MKIYQNLSLENLPDEEWRDVVGYEGLYQVSNLGRIKSLPEIIRDGYKNSFLSKEKIMKTALSNGYVNVNLQTKKS